MKTKLLCTLILGACFLIASAARAGKEKITGPVGWGYASHGPIDVKPTLMKRPAPSVHLGRGALVAILSTKSGKNGSAARWTDIRPTRTS